MSTAIIADPVEEAAARERLERVIKARVRPEKELTPHQWNVLYYIACLGMPIGDVGRTLNISDKTVKAHLTQVALRCKYDYAYAELMQDIRAFYNQELGRDEVRAQYKAHVDRLEAEGAAIR